MGWRDFGHCGCSIRAPARVMCDKEWESQFSFLRFPLKSLFGRAHHSPQPHSFSFRTVKPMLPAPCEARKCHFIKKGNGGTKVSKRSCGNIDQELDFHLLKPSVLATVLTWGSFYSTVLFPHTDHFQPAVGRHVFLIAPIS